MTEMLDKKATAELNRVYDKAFKHEWGETERLILTYVAFRGSLLRFVKPGSNKRELVPELLHDMRQANAGSILLDQDVYDAIDEEEVMVGDR